MADDPKFLVIPAAGLGTRVRAINPDLSKEMLPLGEKPAIQYAIEEGIDAGMEHIVIVINRKKEIIRDHLANHRVSITFLYQEDPRGEADAIALAENVVRDNALAIIYPDNVYLPAPGALRLLTRVFKERKSDIIALTLATPANAMSLSDSGRVDVSRLDGDVYRIRRFHPKGPGHFMPRFPKELRACGIMVSGAHIFDAIRRARRSVPKGEFTDEPVRKLLLSERGLLGLRLPGVVYHIGSPAGYRLCVQQAGP